MSINRYLSGTTNTLHDAFTRHGWTLYEMIRLRARSWVVNNIVDKYNTNPRRIAQHFWESTILTFTSICDVWLDCAVVACLHPSQTTAMLHTAQPMNMIILPSSCVRLVGKYENFARMTFCRPFWQMQIGWKLACCAWRDNAAAYSLSLSRSWYVENNNNNHSWSILIPSSQPLHSFVCTNFRPGTMLTYVYATRRSLSISLVWAKNFLRSLRCTAYSMFTTANSIRVLYSIYQTVLLTML